MADMSRSKGPKTRTYDEEHGVPSRMCLWTFLMQLVGIPPLLPILITGQKVLDENSLDFCTYKEQVAISRVFPLPLADVP